MATVCSLIIGIHPRSLYNLLRDVPGVRLMGTLRHSPGLTSLDSTQFARCVLREDLEDKARRAECVRSLTKAATECPDFNLERLLSNRLTTRVCLAGTAKRSLTAQGKKALFVGAAAEGLVPRQAQACYASVHALLPSCPGSCLL